MSAITAKAVRAAIKSQLGHNSKVVSVTSSGGSVNVTIKSPNVSLSKVSEIAKAFARVSYCESSGEVLSGGNTFVFVDYSDCVLKQVAALVLPLLPTDNTLTDIAGVSAFFKYENYSFRRADSVNWQQSSFPQSAARQIATMIMSDEKFADLCLAHFQAAEKAA
jgi:hypothetical protein